MSGRHNAVAPPVVSLELATLQSPTNGATTLHILIFLKIDFVLANSADPDEIPYYAVFDLGLQFFQNTFLGVYIPQRVKICSEI